MFYLAKIELGRINVPEPEYLEASVAIEAGTALTVNANGKLAVATGTTKPTYVSLADAKAGETVAVGRVRPDNLYDVPVSATPTSLKVGNKVTIAANTESDTTLSGLKVTATTTSGVATIVDLLGASAAGDLVRVRFE